MPTLTAAVNHPDIERAILGTVLYRPDAIAAATGLTAADFHSPALGHIWAAMERLAAAGDLIDVNTVAVELGRDGLLDHCGGTRALVEILAAGGAPTAIGRYARIIVDDARCRRTATLAEQAKTAAASGDLDTAAKLIAAATADLQSSTSTSAFTLEEVAAVTAGELPTLVPTMLRRTDGAALLYPGLTHSLVGEPGSGKSWCALVAATQVLAAGGSVLWLDYEGNRRITGERLRALNVHPEVVADRFRYTRPPAVGPLETVELAALADRERPDLAVIDGVARAIARQGGDEDRASDIVALHEAIVRPLTASGAAVVMVDHVTKAREGRGRWARGSGAKLGEIEGAAYGVETVEGFTRTRPGKIRLKIAKDREGIVGAEGDPAAVITFTPAPGDSLTVAVLAPEWVPTSVAEAVLAALNATANDEVRQAHLLDRVRSLGHSFRDSTVIETVEHLALQGRVRRRKGPHNSWLYQMRSDDVPDREERW